MQIIVENAKVVSEYLGFDVKTHENLLENEKCKEFIKENELYINSINKDDFLDFYYKTGIILEHTFTKCGYKRFNLLGLVETYPYKLYIHHLSVVDDENEIDIKDDDVYLNGKLVGNVRKDLDSQKERFQKFEKFNERLQDIFDNWHYYGDFETSKNELVKYSEDYFEDYCVITNTEHVAVTPYYDVLALTSDGTLYCNDKVYRTNVLYLFEENIFNKIVVYKNDSIEYITANFGGPLYKKYDKVLYSKNCLATLLNKQLEIIIRDDEYIANKSHIVTMQGIDDIEFTNYDYDEIEIAVGDKKIIFDLLGSYIHNVDL